MKPLTFSILRLLSDNEFHSGSAIAQTFGVSRASISNALRDLDETGLTVYKVQGRGYRLLESIQWLDGDAILRGLGNQANSFHLEVLDTIDSTNSLLLGEATKRLSSGSSAIHVIVAELQTRGRGRRGRQWHSGLGDGLAFSMLWRFQQGASFLSGLSLVVGIAIVRALESSDIGGAALKWPNDVVFNFCKLSGVLIELQGDMLGPTVAVIGVGVNLKLSDSIHARINQGVTDIFSICGRVPDRNALLATLLLHLSCVLKEFEQKGFAQFKDEWVNRHIFEGKSITLRLPDGSTQEGTVHGVSDGGELLLQTSAGLRGFSGGEISLRRVA
jgi:BirA family biotin operon repressor/biotin-[acetyl-CoA-carboxylase] ligase